MDSHAAIFFDSPNLGSDFPEKSVFTVQCRSVGLVPLITAGGEQSSIRTDVLFFQEIER